MKGKPHATVSIALISMTRELTWKTGALGNNKGGGGTEQCINVFIGSNEGNHAGKAYTKKVGVTSVIAA